ncbi:MAG: methyl-accepting chemotaxis protein [Planctomycetota bacterium]
MFPLKKLNIRGRLIGAFLLCGIVPICVISSVNLSSARSGSDRVGELAGTKIQQQVESSLVAARDLKKAAITDYFSQIRDQVVTRSDDRMIVDAMRQFTPAFNHVAIELEVDKERACDMHRCLKSYYEDQFDIEFANQNGDTAKDLTTNFKALDGQAIVMQQTYISSNPNPLGSKHLLDKAEASTEYNNLHEKYHPSIRKFLDAFGYYDIFLVDHESGDIVYSVFKELDYATSLIDGPYANTNFGEAFRKANQLDNADDFILVDFDNYWPSYQAPASFIASPIFDGDERLGVLIFQMPVDRINELMVRDMGIGETAETLLIAADGRQRCDSARDAETFSLVNAFRTDDAPRIRTEATKLALDGKSGLTVTTNFRDEEALVAYAPVDLLGLNWVVTSEVTTDEAFSTARELSRNTQQIQADMLFATAVAGVVATAFTILFGYWIASSLARPIRKTVQSLHDIAHGEGDLTKRLDTNQFGELGELSINFNRFVSRIHDIVRSISGNASTLNSAAMALGESSTKLSDGAARSKSRSTVVSDAAQRLSHSMNDVNENTGEIRQSIETVANSVEGMKTTIAEISGNAEQSADVAGQAASAARVCNDKVDGMGDAADEIGKVIEVIEEIAEQTNLLALNATIEAARAGDAGKGFAVVATEVKELAKQTATATEDIRNRIQVMQSSTGEAVSSIQQISDVVAQVNELSRTIASAVDQQRVTTGNIATNINNTVELAGQVADQVADSTRSSREIMESMSGVDEVLEETAVGADQSKQSGEELNRLATEMRSLVDQFRVDHEDSDASKTNLATH